MMGRRVASFVPVQDYFSFYWKMCKNIATAEIWAECNYIDKEDALAPMVIWLCS